MSGWSCVKVGLMLGQGCVEVCVTIFTFTLIFF